MLLLVVCNHCSETYQYYTLPFCQPKGGVKYITEDLGEVLEGDRLATTPFEIKFLQDMEHQQLCNKTLDSKDLDMLRTAVARDFYFQVTTRTQTRACLCVVCNSASCMLVFSHIAAVTHGHLLTTYSAVMHTHTHPPLSMPLLILGAIPAQEIWH